MVKYEKKGVFIGILVVLILIGGCGVRRTEDPTQVNYRTGTEGLTLNLPTGSISKLYAGDTGIKFIVEVRNEGAFPQHDESDFQGRLWIGGYDRNIIDINPDNGENFDEEALEGKSPYNTEGGYESIDFEIDVRNLPDETPFYNPTIIISAAYDYKTIASPIVCIDPEPRSTKIREKVCSIKDAISVGSQGAPVAVTRVEQDVTSDAFLFKIYIENVGGGLVIPDNTNDDPNEGYEWSELNKVEIEDIKVGNEPMSECRPDDDEVDLVDGRGFIFCKFDKRRDGRTYKTPLNIKLKYGYLTSIEKSIEVYEEVSFS